MAQRVLAPVASRAPGEVREVADDLERLATDAELFPDEKGAVDSLRALMRALPSGSFGLGTRDAPFEPGTLPARLLSEIAAGVTRADADLAERLGTDPWQVSRAGRRLRELGLAERARAGRMNTWRLTEAGERQVLTSRRQKPGARS